MKCKWYAAFEGVCTNGECQYLGDVCPTCEHPEVCKYAGNRYEVSELVKILRCGAGDEHKCADCAVNLKNKCDRKEENRQAADMLEKLAEEGKNASFIALYYGEDVSEADAQAAGAKFQAICPDAEISVLSGGQPVYYYIISFE